MNYQAPCNHAIPDNAVNYKSMQLAAQYAAIFPNQHTFSFLHSRALMCPLRHLLSIPRTLAHANLQPEVLRWEFVLRVCLHW